MMRLRVRTQLLLVCASLISPLLNSATVSAAVIARASGAIFRVKEEEHLAAAFEMSVAWVQQNIYKNILVPLRGKIRYLPHRGISEFGMNALDSVCALVDKDDAVGIIGPSNQVLRTEKRRIEALTNRLRIPLINPFWSSRKSSDEREKEKSNFTVEIFPESDLVQVVWKWLKASKWKNFVFIYANGNSLLHFHEILSDPEFHIQFLKIDLNYMEATVHKLAEITDHCLQWGCRKEEFYVFLDIPDLNLHSFFHLSDVLMIFDSVLAFALGHSNVSKFYPVVNKRKYFPKCNLRRFHLEPIPYSFGHKLINFIKYQNSTGFTGKVKFSKAGTRKNAPFYISELGYDGHLHKFLWYSNYNQMGHDAALSPLYITKQMKPHLRITTIESLPYMALKKNFKYFSGNDQFEGFCADLIKQLAKDLDFTYNIRFVADGQYGALKNGSWNGMIGEIIQNEADIAIGPLTITFQRAEAVSFTKPFLQHGISMLVRSPQEKDASFEAFLYPLTPGTWLCTLGSFFLVVIVMFIVARITPYEWHRVEQKRPLLGYRGNMECSRCSKDMAPEFRGFLARQPISHKSEEILENRFNLSYTAWYVFSTFLKAGTEDSPSAVSTRLIAGIWWITTLILIHTYTANFAAVLTVDRQDMPISNFEALFNKSKFSFGALEGGSTLQFFKESHLPIFQRLYQRMHEMEREDVFLDSEQEGVSRVMEGNYAYFIESTSLEYLISRNCNLTQAGTTVIGNNGYGIAMQKGSPLIDTISKAILNYTENGVIPEFKHRWWTTKAAVPCPKRELSKMKDERRSLSIYDVMGLFVTFSGSLCAACIVALVEFIIIRRRDFPTREKSFLGDLCTTLWKSVYRCCDDKKTERRIEVQLDASVPECRDCRNTMEWNGQAGSFGFENQKGSTFTPKTRDSNQDYAGTHVPLKIYSTRPKRRWNVSEV